jgi:hypothetical protein
MSEFLPLIENMSASDAGVRQLFGDAGTSVRPSASRARSPQYLLAFARTMEFMEQVVTGQRPSYHLKEALSTSDFPGLFGDILDRQLLANYQEAPYSYSNYSKISTVNDFRLVKRIRMDGAQSALPVVPEGSEYPATTLSSSFYTFQVQKHGKRMPFTWETLIDDDLGALSDIPQRFGVAARRSIERFATTLFTGSTGPNTTFFSTANKNQVITTNGALSNNPALSVPGLQSAMIVLANQKDNDGEPITIEAMELVVSPSQQIIAENILNATQLWLNDAGGTANERLISQNWMKGRVRLSVNSYLPVVDTTTGTTAWYLFASPSNGRPAIEIGFLRGHETPELFMKAPNAVRIGGGNVDPTDGDFDTDTIQYKVRFCFGGTLEDPRMSVVSLGTGS